MINVTTAKTAELVAFYNDHAAELDLAPVKKFADRATAEKRVSKMVDALLELRVEDETPTHDEHGNSLCPHCGDTAIWSVEDLKDQYDNDLRVATGISGNRLDAETKADFAARLKDLREIEGSHYCIACGESSGDKNPLRKVSYSANRSAGIAQSWTNPEIAEKRSARHVAVVDGHEFRSVRAAFIFYNLPLNQHIKFRMELKAAGKLEAYGKTWEVKEA